MNISNYHRTKNHSQISMSRKLKTNSSGFYVPTTCIYYLDKICLLAFYFKFHTSEQLIAKINNILSRTKPTKLIKIISNAELTGLCHFSLSVFHNM